MKAMATWPAQGDYRDALQNLDLAFRDADLRSCTVERNRINVPRARAGAFASVYKLTRPNGQALALKLFNFPSEDRQRRYQKVSEHLTKLGSRRPGCLVEFTYQLDGIRVGSGQFPIQTMAWVTGLTLGQWVRERMASRDYGGVRKMADHWVELVTTLRAADIAHGDLQHDNVMVQADRPVLVDYDGMCVPGLEGAEQLENGKPAYQHPQRAQEVLSLDLDHFSAWIILIALRAIAAEPDLYLQFVERPENENLLFAEADIRDPAKSLLWPRLFKSKDPEVGPWARDLHASISGPVAQVPRFGLNPAARLVELCAASTPDWDAIVTEADRLVALKKPIPSTPPEVPNRVTAARQRHTARDQVRTALMAKDIPGLKKAFNETLFADWPAQAGLAAQARRTLELQTTLDQLAAAKAKNDQGQSLKQVLQACSPMVQKDPAVAPYQFEVQLWDNRQAALTRFRDAMKPLVVERKLAQAWADLVKLGSHPALTPAEVSRGKLAEQRSAQLDKLKAIPVAETETADKGLVAAWDASLLDACPEADPYKLRLPVVQTRLAQLALVEAAILAADRGQGSDVEVIAAADKLPKSYQYSLSARVQLARDGQEQFAELVQVLGAAPPSDIQIAAAWKRLQSRHAKQAARVDPMRRERCLLAVRRADALAAIENAIQSPGSDYDRDLRIFKAFKPNQDDLKGCLELKPHRDRIQLAYDRLKAWQELGEAIKARDVVQVPVLSKNPILAKYPPLLAEQERIQELNTLGFQISGILEKVRAAQQGTPFTLSLDEFDFLRQSPHLFTPDVRRQMLTHFNRRLGAHVRLMPGVTPFYLTPGGIPQAKIFWTWSGYGFVSKFVLASNADQALTDVRSVPELQLSDCTPADHARDGGGRTILLGPGAELWVSVWPVVELWGEQLFGSPLTIGPIRVGGKGRR